MSWAWEAKLDCGHTFGGTVETRDSFVTPYELGDEFKCPSCRKLGVVVLTTGRGR